MSQSPAQIAAIARKAARSNDWATVGACATELLRRDVASPEGYFLAGMVEKAAKRPNKAALAFERALELDSGRYDAAIELASRYSVTGRHAESYSLLRRYAPHLSNSPRYLDMAGLTYSTIGLHEQALPLHRMANELQPGIPRFQANLAACSVYLGRIEEAKALYRSLLDRAPTHQRNHYQLARLERATDATHVEQMKSILRATNLPAEKNIFLYYAIGKELEDLGQWEEAFRHYQMAGDAVASVARYDVSADIELVDRITQICDAEWLATGAEKVPPDAIGKTPVFIVGLPRTGTTLTERILASHSRVGSIGESMAMQTTLQRVSGAAGTGNMNPAIIEAAARQDIGLIAKGYLDAVAHRLGDQPMFIEKFPENFLYLGFIAKAFPDAGMLYLRRNPMDACFAMYKQSYFKFAYALEDVGRYYVAHDRLLRHWRQCLGERLIEIEYESVVADPEVETRKVLTRLGLAFEPACLEFEKNESASATASAVQVRERIHARSVNRWRHFERELQPLRQLLESAGIALG